MLRVAFCVCAVLFVGAAAAAEQSSFEQLRALAANDPGVKIEDYQVSGLTISELKTALRSNGPRDKNGKSYDAYTRWRLRWTWPLGTKRQPLFENSKVRYEATVDFPIWSDWSEAAPAVVAEWKRFREALAEHELVHITNMERGVREIEAELKGFAERRKPPSPQEANKLLQDLVKETRRRDWEFDRETNSGVKNGVRLDPVE